MRPAFNVPEYGAGFEYMRQALLQGLAQLPPDQGAQSWLIGAYCGLVRLVWDKRNPASNRVQVGAVLATVLADVLREADDLVEAEDSPAAVMLEAFNFAAIACSPMDDQGQALADGDVILRACGTYAAQLLFTLEDKQARAVRLGEFETFVGQVLERLDARKPPPPKGPGLVLLDGGRK